jgi:hypothetical protein
MAVLKVSIFGDVLELEGMKVEENKFKTQNWVIEIYQSEGKQFCRFTEPIPFDTYVKKGYLLSDSENSFIDELTEVLAIEGEEREAIVRESLYKYWITHPDLVRKYNFEDFLAAYMNDELEIDLSDYVTDMINVQWLEKVVNFCKSVPKKEFECWIEE